MSKCVMKHIHTLDAIARAKPAQRRDLLQRANFNLIKAIDECIENVLNGNVKLNPTQLKKLKKYKNHLRKVKRSCERWSSKKKVIIQSGGAFLPALLLPIIGAIASKFI